MNQNESYACSYKLITTHSMPQLTRETVHVWHIPYCNADFSSVDLKCLSSEEFDRAKRYFHEYQSKQYCLSRYAIRNILSAYTKLAPEDVQFGFSKYKKPFLINNEMDITFNISHSAHISLLSVSKKNAIGVDLELVRSIDDLDSISRNIMSTSEYLNFKSASFLSRELLFFNAWARKEAFVKALGAGLYYPLKQVDIGSFPIGKRYSFSHQDLNGNMSLWTFEDFAISYNKHNYKACVLWKGNDCEVSNYLFNVKSPTF